MIAGVINKRGNVDGKSVKKCFSCLSAELWCELKIQLASVECAFSKSGEGEGGIPYFFPKEEQVVRINKAYS